MVRFDHPRAILPALLSAWLLTVAHGCDSGAGPTDPARGTLELNPPTDRIAPGEVLIIPFQFSDGSDTSPIILGEWSSSDPGVALVDRHGAVTALATGTTWIRAEHDGARDSLLLTVRPIRYRQIVAGHGWACGLTPEGALYCWGRVLPGGVHDRTFPLRIAPELLFDRLALEEIYLCAFGKAGDLYCDPNTGERTLQKVPGGPYLQVTSTGGMTCGITTAGSAFCGPRNFLAPGPIDVPPLAAIDMGGSLSQCGVTPDGEVWCWGLNWFGQLGNGDRVESAVPLRVETSLRFRQIEAGDGFTCGVTFDDEIWCWGLVLYGAPAQSVSLSPYPVFLPTPVNKIESGGFYGVCALTRGEVWCMGGPLLEPPHRIDGLPPLVDVSVGTGLVCGTTEDHEGWCFGANNFGQRGIGSLSETIAPPTRVADRSGRPH